MNFGILKQHVKRNLGNRTDIDTLIESWINNTYLDLVTRGRFEELQRFGPIPIPALDDTTTQNTALGVPDYALPTNALFIVSMRDTTNDVPLRQKGIRWYDRNKATSNGKPGRYAEYGGRFYIDPTPDGTYVLQIRFRKKISLPALSQDSQSPLIGEEWHETIELGATYRGARSLGDVGATKWLTDWKSHIVSHLGEHTESEEDADIGFSVSF